MIIFLLYKNYISSSSTLPPFFYIKIITKPLFILLCIFVINYKVFLTVLLAQLNSSIHLLYTFHQQSILRSSSSISAHVFDFQPHFHLLFQFLYELITLCLYALAQDNLFIYFNHCLKK